MRQIGLIGFGTIGSSIAADLARRPIEGVVLAAVCVRPQQRAEAEAMLPGVRIVDEVEELSGLKPGLIIETAGQGFVRDHGEAILRRGQDLCVVSVGALADPELRARLAVAAQVGGGRIQIPAGALAGFDGLLALARHGIESVCYTSTKPCGAWKGTPADRAYRLDELKEVTTIFVGTAADAARLYPKNANLAAAVALAGVGFERTEIRLVADPTATGNHARMEALGPNGSLCVDVTGRGSARNPKTSVIVGSSIVAALQNHIAPIQFI